MRIALVLLGIALLGGAFWIGWRAHTPRAASSSETAESAVQDVSVNGVVPAKTGYTNVYAHNLMLRKGPSFRFYVRWLRGDMVPENKKITPSFDDTGSFFLRIRDGVLRANIGDIANYLNSGALENSPLSDVKLQGNGTVLNLTGTVHKLIPIPVQISGELAIVSGQQVRYSVQKIDILKIPLKWLLNSLHVDVADLVGKNKIAGVDIQGNDIIFDTGQLLPPPHIQGQLTTVRVVNPDLEVIYGDATADVQRVEQWRNFISLRGGSLDFGKLTMHDVDLTMIDISSDPWFDIDLAQYQQQLVNGYTHMTPQAGLQIFMPDLRTLPKTADTKTISLEWMKNRYAPVPKSVTEH